jgi:hypothetical protein
VLERRPRILLTARDPATAENMRVLGKEIVEDGRLEVYLAAQDPAFSLLQTTYGIADHQILVPAFDTKQHLISYSRKLLLSTVPDIVLTGVSGPDFGIDEAVLSLAPRGVFGPYALQSYWGDVNDAFPISAQTYLVLDDYAAQLTEARLTARTIVVGSFRHWAYHGLDTQKMRRDFRGRQNIKGDTLVLGLYGQPFPLKHPYRKTIELFANELQKGAPFGTRLIYRPHPKEDQTQTDWVRRLFMDSQSVDFRIDLGGGVEQSLCGCDYAVSAFSSCGYDLQQLLNVSSAPLAAPVYLMFDPEFVTWFRDQTRLTTIPMSDRGMSRLVSSLSDIRSILDSRVVETIKKTCWESVVRHFPRNNGDPARAIEILLEHYRREFCAC